MGIPNTNLNRLWSIQLQYLFDRMSSAAEYPKGSLSIASKILLLSSSNITKKLMFEETVLAYLSPAAVSELYNRTHR